MPSERPLKRRRSRVGTAEPENIANNGDDWAAPERRAVNQHLRGPSSPTYKQKRSAESANLAGDVVALASSPLQEAVSTRHPSLAPRVFGARYRCNYCSRDISNCTRITCAVCPDFDLCISCFSVGASVYPHEASHPYRVVEYVSRPVFSTEWSAEEELRLLEGLEMYGPGNFQLAAEYVGTKSKIKCEQHYLEVYLDAVDTAPLPNPERILSETRAPHPSLPPGTARSAAVARELALTAAAAASLNPALARLIHAYPVTGDAKTTAADNSRTSKASRFPEASVATGELDHAAASLSSPATSQSDGIQTPKASNDARSQDGSQGMVKGPTSGDSPETVTCDASWPQGLSDDTPEVRISPPGRPRKGDIAGYMPKRQDYDVEPFQNDAELLIADMYITDEDTAEERELKLRILEIYSFWLDERSKRKTVVEQRSFTDLPAARARERAKSPLERRVGRLLLPFVRLTIGQGSQFDEFAQRLVTEVCLAREVTEIWEALRSGVRDLSEFEHWKRERLLRERLHTTPFPVDVAEPPVRPAESTGALVSNTFQIVPESAAPRRRRGRPVRIRTEEAAPGAAVVLSNAEHRSGLSTSDRRTPTVTTLTTGTQALAMRVLQSESAAEVTSWSSIVHRQQTPQPRGAAPLSGSSDSSPTPNLLFVDNWPSAKRLSPLEKELCAILRLVPDRFLEIRTVIAKHWKEMSEQSVGSAHTGGAQDPLPAMRLALDLRPRTGAATQHQQHQQHHAPGTPSSGRSETLAEMQPVATERMRSNEQASSGSSQPADTRISGRESRTPRPYTRHERERHHRRKASGQ